MEVPIDSPVGQCKTVLEELLSDSPDIPLSTRESISRIDDTVRDYLLQKGYKEWLADNVTCGFQIGRISELALCSFIREGRVFENKGRRYQLHETFGQMSVRSFYAMAV